MENVSIVSMLYDDVFGGKELRSENGYKLHRKLLIVSGFARDGRLIDSNVNDFENNLDSQEYKQEHVTGY